MKSQQRQRRFEMSEIHNRLRSYTHFRKVNP